MEFVKIFLIVLVSVLFIKYFVLPFIEKIKNFSISKTGIEATEVDEKIAEINSKKVPDALVTLTKEEYPSLLMEPIKIPDAFYTITKEAYPAKLEAGAFVVDFSQVVYISGPDDYLKITYKDSEIRKVRFDSVEEKHRCYLKLQEAFTLYNRCPIEVGSSTCIIDLRKVFKIYRGSQTLDISAMRRQAFESKPVQDSTYHIRFGYKEDALKCYKRLKVAWKTYNDYHKEG